MSEGGDTERELEQYKHRLKLRELVFDKLVLGLIVGLAVWWAGGQLARRDHALAVQLEQQRSELTAGLDDLRVNAERRRVLAEREILAYEETWETLVGLHAYLLEREGLEIEEREIVAFRAKLAATVAVQALYLPDELSAKVRHLLDEPLADLVVASGLDGGVSEQSLAAIEKELEALGGALRDGIYARRRAGEGPGE